MYGRTQELVVGAMWTPLYVQKMYGRRQEHQPKMPLL